MRTSNACHSPVIVTGFPGLGRGPATLDSWCCRRPCRPARRSILRSFPSRWFVLEQVGQGQAQHLGDLAQVQQGDVPLAALHAADEGAVQLAALAQFGLGPAEVLAALAEADADFLQKSLVVEV